MNIPCLKHSLKRGQAKTLIFFSFPPPTPHSFFFPKSGKPVKTFVGNPYKRAKRRRELIRAELT